MFNPKNKARSEKLFYLSVILGLLATFLTFISIATTHLMTEYEKNPYQIEEYVMATPPPPPPLEEEEPPPPPEPEEPPPTLDSPPPPITLEQLDVILNPGTGTAGIIAGDFALPQLRDINQNDLGSLQIFEISDLDQKPRPKRQKPPIFPPAALRKGLNGRVVIEFIIMKDGRVSDTKVVKSSDPLFEPYAINAVKQWTFTPGKKDGKSVNTRTQVPIPFNVL